MGVGDASLLERLSQTGAGASGTLVATILRAARTPKGTEVRCVIKHVTKRLRQHWPNTRIVWRGDSHYGRVEAMEWAGRTFLSSLRQRLLCRRADPPSFTSTGALGRRQSSHSSHVLRLKSGPEVLKSRCCTDIDEPTAQCLAQPLRIGPLPCSHRVDLRKHRHASPTLIVSQHRDLSRQIAGRLHQKQAARLALSVRAAPSMGQSAQSGEHRGAAGAE
jgi:hypothetical protein